MARLAGLIIVLVLVLATSPSPAFGQSPAAGSTALEDIIVLFKQEVPRAERADIVKRAGAVTKVNFMIVSAAAVRANPAAKAALEKAPGVVAIVPDRKVAIVDGPEVAPEEQPTGRGKPGGSASTGQVLPAGVKRIGADQAWATSTGAGVGVAVVDTGIDFGHTDLAVATACFTAFTSCQDDHGHGTHVAGIIAAKNNTQDVVGVAHGATLYAVKVLDQSGSGSDSTVMAGLEWVSSNANLVSPAIRVVNMSLGRAGTLEDNPALRAAVQALYNQGIEVVVAAGNDASKEVSQQVPATYPEAMAVASTTAVDGGNRCKWYSGSIRADTASYFTTDGKYNPDTRIGITVSAPGEDKEDISPGCSISSVGILSTARGGGTTRMSGTSMAAPHVAGVVALMQQSGSLSPEEVRAKLQTSADRQGASPLDSPTSSYTYDGEREGIVWAPGALQ